MVTYRYMQYDVFTRRPLTGNQLAVFPEPSGLTSCLMQRLALEMACPETTFILPPDDGETDVRLRIFTPRRELPMAGHPTIGSTFALAGAGLLGSDRSQIVFGLGVGPTPVALEWAGNELDFAWMRQPMPELGPAIDERREVTSALSLAPEALAPALPVQVASSGVPFLLVPLSTRRDVDAATLDRSALRPLLARRRLDELPVFLFSLEQGHDDATAYSRMFAPGFGIPEDPATGGATGPLAAYLVHHGAVARETTSDLVILQGVAMKRPSRLHIGVEVEDGMVTSVRVGGTAVLVAEGTVYL